MNDKITRHRRTKSTIQRPKKKTIDAFFGRDPSEEDTAIDSSLSPMTESYTRDYLSINNTIESFDQQNTIGNIYRKHLLELQGLIHDIENSCESLPSRTTNVVLLRNCLKMISNFDEEKLKIAVCVLRDL